MRCIVLLKHLKSFSPVFYHFIFENKGRCLLIYILHVKKLVMFGNFMTAISTFLFLRHSGLFDLLHVININIVD